MCHQKGDFDMNHTQYFSIVTSRIKELQEELESIQKMASNESLNLQEDILKHKINYLKRLTNLPVLTIIANMNNDELAYMESILDISKEEVPSYLIHLFQLDNLVGLVNQPLTVTYSEIKDTLLEDYHSMNTMISLQQQMFKTREVKANLYGTVLHQNPNSYSQLLKDEKELEKKQEKVEATIKDIDDTFNQDTLRELRSYAKNPKQKLSMDFILKHKDKVIKDNPKMEKLVNRLTKGKLSKLSFFRKKQEQEFLNAVIATYQNDTSLSYFGIDKINVLELEENDLTLLSQCAKSKLEEERQAFQEEKAYLEDKKENLLEQIETFDNLERECQSKFNQLLHQKIDYLPLKRIEQQMWYDQNLKESLITEACLQEQRKLMKDLTAPFQTTASLEILANLENYQPDEDEFTKSKIA